MNGLRFSCGTMALALAMAAGPLLAADDHLTDVKRLYVAAQYEDALVALGRGVPASSNDADEYRVLCLLALGRGADAEQVVERIVLRNPLALPDLEGRSPRFTTTYQRVRKRIQAVVAPTMYGLARASFDAGSFAVASAQFKELVVLLDKTDGNAEPLTDMRMLADGFSRLSSGRVAALEPVAPRAAAPNPANESPQAPELPVVGETPVAGELPVEETLVAFVSPSEVESAPAADARPFAPWRPQIFGPDDTDVTPPVVIDQQMPAWLAPAGFANKAFRGVVEILVAENGLVTSVKTVERTHPLYDNILLASAKQWRYEPAVKDGRPVPYRKTLVFTLRGTK